MPQCKLASSDVARQLGQFTRSSSSSSRSSGGLVLMRPVMRYDVHAQARRCPRGRSWLASPTMLFLAALALSTHLASAALPTGTHIDAASIAALSAGQDVCGDDTHGSACLRVMVRI